MNPVWWTPFIILAGALQAFGAVMSAQLRISLANPWLSLAVLFALNFFFFAALFAVSPRPLPTVEGIAAMPWWAPLAGLTGAVAVFAGLALIDKLGAGMVNGLIIAAKSRRVSRDRSFRPSERARASGKHLAPCGRRADGDRGCAHLSFLIPEP